MTLTACPDHRDVAPVRTMTDAISMATILAETVHKYDRHNSVGYYIATYQRNMREARCCPASSYAGYLMMAAWRGLPDLS